MNKLTVYKIVCFVLLIILALSVCLGSNYEITILATRCINKKLASLITALIVTKVTTMTPTKHNPSVIYVTLVSSFLNRELANPRIVGPKIVRFVCQLCQVELILNIVFSASRDIS